MNIYISNLDLEVNKKSLKDIFLAYGEVTSSRIILDQMTGKSRGIGFVNMPEPEAARTAIEVLNGKLVKGKRLMVNEALSKNKSAKRRFY